MSAMASQLPGSTSAKDPLLTSQIPPFPSPFLRGGKKCFRFLSLERLGGILTQQRVSWKETNIPPQPLCHPALVMLVTGSKHTCQAWVRYWQGKNTLKEVDKSI